MTRAPDAGYEPFEVDADVGIRAWAATRAEVFAQIALGVFSLVVDPREVLEAERREIRAQGDSPEQLLVNWLNECLYVHEIEDFVVGRVEVLACGDAVVHGLLHGEPIDTARHRPGTVVKAATSHGVSLTECEGVHEARVIVDV
jgi:SHS2 domain-containing protein